VQERKNRDGERIEILGELHGEVMVFEPMAIREISRGGMQIETAFPLQLDSLHDFRLSLGERSVVIKGRIVHCSISDVDQEVVVYRSGARRTRRRRVHSGDQRRPQGRINLAILRLS